MPIPNATDPISPVAPVSPDPGPPLPLPRGAGGERPRLHWRHAALTAGVLALVGTALWIKAIPCAFAGLFHVPCPGCGSTRACLALASGDLAAVFRNNPLGPAMAAFMAVFAVQALVSSLTRGDLRGVGEGRLGGLLKRGFLFVAILEVVIWIARFFGALGGPVAV